MQDFLKVRNVFCSISPTLTKDILFFWASCSKGSKKLCSCGPLSAGLFCFVFSCMLLITLIPGYYCNIHPVFSKLIVSFCLFGSEGVFSEESELNTEGAGAVVKMVSLVLQGSLLSRHPHIPHLRPMSIDAASSSLQSAL